jgi:tellurite resistance protein
MPSDEKIHLLAKIARMKGTGHDMDGPLASSSGGGIDSGSILMLAAASYGAKPPEDATIPTGFDPVAVALFESIVEGAYLVASADGVFDDDERHAFERVVHAACGGVVAPKTVQGLVSDLSDQLSEDGIDRRIEMIGTHITKKSHGQEVLRIAALIAQASADVSPVERDMLLRIAGTCGLASEDVDTALREVKEALSKS